MKLVFLFIIGLFTRAIASDTESSTTETTKDDVLEGNETLPAPWMQFPKIFVVLFENHGYNQCMGSSTWKAMLNDSFVMNEYYGVAHPTQPNYIAILAGSTMGVTGNGAATLSGETVVDLLEKKNLTWKYYGEDYTSYGGCNTNFNRRNMNPFLSFTSITSDSTRCKNIVSDYQLFEDIEANNLPNFGFYSPNNNHNGHNNGVSGAGSYLAAFLEKWYYPYQNTTFNETLFMLTWDEDGIAEGADENNHILTFFKHPCLATGSSSIKYNHYSITRFLEDNFDLGSLGRGDVTAENFGLEFQDICVKEDELLNENADNEPEEEHFKDPSEIPSSETSPSELEKSPSNNGGSSSSSSRPWSAIDTNPLFKAREPWFHRKNIWLGIGIPTGGLSILVLLWIWWLNYKEKRKDEYLSLLKSNKGRHYCKYHQDSLPCQHSHSHRSEGRSGYTSIVEESDSFDSKWAPGSFIPLTALPKECPPTCSDDECRTFVIDDSMGIDLSQHTGPLSFTYSHMSSVPGSRVGAIDEEEEGAGKIFFQDDSVYDKHPVFGE